MNPVHGKPACIPPTLIGVPNLTLITQNGVSAKENKLGKSKYVSDDERITSFSSESLADKVKDDGHFYHQQEKLSFAP